eukprot:TRINITY_DN32252_c0_g1_i4.p1 TRINITY_DN32252_c0_g1~~TRINITY_DN32252_c0_g1_i4.p1  ORF type:complete len:491 (+),score=84.12 TRINITY_DN32252_c0_g1_i4:78-1475(+)
MVEVALEETGVIADLCEKEQTANFRKYVMGKTEAVSEEWSSRGPRSVSPFSPCADTRVPHIFAAARLTSEDVLYDMGCGDGRVLHEAAARFGCRCVGIEVDESCLVDCRAGAAALGDSCKNLFRWELADFMELGDDFFVTGRLPGGAEPLPPPTVVLIFITGHGLVSLAPWLHRAWSAAKPGVRLLTCVEALDTARDYNEGIFAETNLQGWKVYRDDVHAKYGVFVVPPCECSLDKWQSSQPVKLPLTWQFADESQPALVRGLLSSADVKDLRDFAARVAPADDAAGGAVVDAEAAMAGILFGDSDMCSQAEDALHSLREHRVLHLHADGIDDAAIRHVRAKVLQALYRVDAERWNALPGRSVYVRSFEHHSYEAGGSVMDPEHRDQGSILTISVLLHRSLDCEGGIFRAVVGDAWQEFEDIGLGDAVIFLSDKRHGVTPLVQGVRESLVMELWERGVTRRNRHN